MKMRGILCLVLSAGVLLVASAARGGDFRLPQLEPYLSPDGRMAFNDPAPLVLVADPDPAAQGIWEPDDAEYSVAAATATFRFKYLAAGQKDPWG